MIQFKTSSFCSLGDCVEVGRGTDGSFVLCDSKDPRPETWLRFTPDEWATFVAEVKAGQHDATGATRLLPLAVGEDDAEVWIPPRTDAMLHRPDKPCQHCGGSLWHVRTRRCGDCGRRPS